MADDPAQEVLTIEAGAWSDDAALWLSQATGSDSVEDLRQQAEQGASLFYVRHKGATVGAFLLRVDRTAAGAEGVIVSAAAALDGVDMIASCMPSIEARFVGCQRLRYHTRSPALVRKLARIDYRPQEIVCIKNLEP